MADYYTVNQQGTASLFQFLITHKISPDKIIYLSSLAAAGPSLDGKAVNEKDIPHPITPYGKSKLRGEEEVLKYKDNFSVVIMRTGVVFGPRDRGCFPYFTQIKKGILPSLRGSRRLLSLCYVKDLLRAFYFCLQKELKSGEIFNIADSRPHDWDEMGKAAGQVMGRKLKKISIPLSIAYIWALIAELTGIVTRKPSIFNRNKFKEMKQKGWIADVQKAKEKLSFQTQYTLEEAIKETIQWYLKHKWL